VKHWGTDHRPYPPPKMPWVLAQTWHDALFVHFAISVTVLRHALPASLPLDTYEGRAWISIVAFGVKHFRPRGLPPLPKLSAFPEINLRTYVTLDNKPGIYVFSFDTNNLLGVLGARVLYHLRYFYAHVSLERIAECVHFHSQRKGSFAAFDARYCPDGPIHYSERGSLDYWLTERYCIYTIDQRQRTYRVEAHHAQWSLQNVKYAISTNTLATMARVTWPEMPARLHYSQRQDVVLWPLMRL
jgi:uncharacterized protein